jgi:hypothetical protein
MISLFQICFISSGDMAIFLFKFQTEIFISILKNEIFQIFVPYFYCFSFPFGGMANFFSNFKIEFFVQFFHFLWWYGQFFFKIQKQKISILQKMKNFQFFPFKFSLWHKRFFLGLRLPNLLKDCKKLPIYP